MWGEAGRPWEGSGWGYRTGLLPPGEGALSGAVAAWTRPRGLGGGVEEHRPNLGGGRACCQGDHLTGGSFRGFDLNS